MSLIQWNNNYSVKIEKLDKQHKILIGIINKLHNSMKEGKGKEILSEVLKELIVKHSKRLYFRKEIIVLSIQKDYISGKRLLTIEIIVFLNDWLYDHIIASDKKYASFLHAQGIK